MSDATGATGEEVEGSQKRNLNHRRADAVTVDDEAADEADDEANAVKVQMDAGVFQDST